MKLYNPEEVPIPPNYTEALVFRNKQDGLLYYKLHSSQISPLKFENGSYYIHDKSITRIINFTDETIDSSVYEGGIIIRFYLIPTVVVGGGGGGSRGPQGYQGAQGASGSGASLVLDQVDSSGDLQIQNAETPLSLVYNVLNTGKARVVLYTWCFFTPTQESEVKFYIKLNGVVIPSFSKNASNADIPALQNGFTSNPAVESVFNVASGDVIEAFGIDSFGNIACEVSQRRLIVQIST